MEKYQTVFMRREKKYLVDPAQYAALKSRFMQELRRDEFYRSTVCSIYFDASEHRLIRDSLEKPEYKEKLRLRSYGVPAPDGTVFAEIKKKYSGLGSKRRTALPLRAAEAWLYDGGPAPAEALICREIDCLIGRNPGIAPAMYIAGERTSWRGEGGLRITFDHSILWRDTDLHLGGGVWGAELLPPKMKLMEIKTGDAMPLWLARELSALELYPTSFSKYGKAYMTGETAREKGGVVCA